MTAATDTATENVVRIVRISRRFEAPREDVYRAWTNPDEVAAW